MRQIIEYHLSLTMAYSSPYGDIAGLGAPSYFNQQQYQQRDAAYAQADTQAASEAGDQEAAANAASAAQSNSLAQQLAQARNTPGGGIRRGLGRGRSLTAGSATAGGLNAANAAGKLSRKKAELRAAADNQLTQQNVSEQKARSASIMGSTGIGQPIYLGLT